MADQYTGSQNFGAEKVIPGQEELPVEQPEVEVIDDDEEDVDTDLPDPETVDGLSDDEEGNA